MGLYLRPPSRASGAFIMEMEAANSYEQVCRHILIMGEMAERNTQAAIMALVDRDNEMAADAIAYDREMDEVELALDALCIEILERCKPTGEDLRLVVGAMKICSSLERISDLAVEIAKHVLLLTAKRSVLRDQTVGDLAEMLDAATGMVRDSVGALENQDAERAWLLMRQRKQVAVRRESIENALSKAARADGRLCDRVTRTVLALHALERIGEQAANIAEEVIFIVTGNVVKHHLDEFRPKHDEN